MWRRCGVETSATKERESGREVLFPVRFDNTVLEINAGWPALLKNSRHIGDFTRREEHSPYRKAFERLLRDLKAGA